MNPPNPNETPAATLRLFIALPVSDAVKVEIQRAQEQLRQELPKSCARWTRPEQWHLTLKFFGNLAAGRVGALTDAVRAAGAGFAPWQLKAAGISCFPDLRYPRVVWAGVHDAGNGLAELQAAVERAAAGFTVEERAAQFTGHITIARINRLRPPQAEILAKLAQDMAQREFGDWTADAIEIMRSELSPAGARHTCLARLPLGGTRERDVS